MIELEEIFTYISERNKIAASAVVTRIERISERLGSFPFTATETDEAGSRILPVVRYPFMLYYAVDESFDEVVILHVRHTARKKPVANDPHTGLF